MKKKIGMLILFLCLGSAFSFNAFRVHTLGVDATVYTQEKNAGSLGLFAQKWLFWGGTGISSGDQFLGVYGEFGFILPFRKGITIIPTGRLIFGGQQDASDEIEYDFRSAMGIAFETKIFGFTIIPKFELRGLQDSGVVLGWGIGVPFR